MSEKALTCFNSLQTGKRIQSDSNVHLIVREYEFQFPSNGKAYPKVTVTTPDGLKKKFQFPSNGKAYPKPKK